MHIRPKPWARPELLACGFFIPEATELRGHWQDAFERRAPLHLELARAPLSPLWADAIQRSTTWRWT